MALRKTALLRICDRNARLMGATTVDFSHVAEAGLVCATGVAPHVLKALLLKSRCPAPTGFSSR